ncbi:MAG: methionyl-tRNA formyltransferase [Candidatus Izemoplasmatales bacterium]|jgi:methionyl-tRNA formyltransferase
MRIVFMGTTDFAVPILFGLAERHQVVLVVTQPDKPVGRKKILKPSSVKICAGSLSIPVFQPESIKKDYSPILDANAELIVVAAYGQMIPREVLYYPKYKSINVHASLLPKYRGGAPMQRAIMAGEEKTGVTVMYMAPKMDSGPILAQDSLIILPEDNLETIEGKLAIKGKNLLLRTLDKLVMGEIEAKPQDEEEATYGYNIRPEEERIDFHDTAVRVRDKIRALYPRPIAHALINGQKLKILKATALDTNEFVPAEAGEIVHADKEKVLVSTSQGLVSLQKVQLEGRNAMSIQTFMNGIGRTLLVKGRKFK